MKLKNGKPNQPEVFTAAEGEKSLPDDLVDCIEDQAI
jgi:uncharacterized radical SAM superfamily Fe-S cluster-containing enzyme